MIRRPLCAILPALMRHLPLLALLSLLACGSSRVSLTGEVRYGKTAEEDYQAGVEEAKGENWVEAVKFLEHCRTKYPFSRYAALAELKLADIKYDQDRLVEAADAYATFVKMHPTHEEADRAAFREGEALLKDGPTDFLLFPPAHERELKTVRDGAGRLEAFLKRWPESRHRPQAEKLLAGARRQLAEHEWYVADFYRQRQLWAGAAGRFQALVDRYPGTPREVDALLALAEAWEKLDDRFKARQALQQLLARHPGDPRRPLAERRLEALR